MSEFAATAGASVIIIFIALIVCLSLIKYQISEGVPIVRAGIPSTWALKEGFQGSLEPIKRTLEQWLPAPEALIKKSECDTNAPAPYKNEGKNSLNSYALLSDSLTPVVDPCPLGPTAQQCWNKDYTRSLERAGSFAQRTNNYQHGNAESCSAWNHDLILGFYKPVTSEGAYQV
jgi:hypothetical protein